MSESNESDQVINGDIWGLPVGAMIEVVLYEGSSEPIHVRVYKHDGGWFANDGTKYLQDGSIIGKWEHTRRWEFKRLIINPLNSDPVEPEPEPEPKKPSLLAKGCAVAFLFVFGWMVVSGFIWVWGVVVKPYLLGR